MEKFKFFAALTSSSASSSPTLLTDNGSTTTTHKSMITIGAPPKRAIAKSLSDVSTYLHEKNNNNNYENEREFDNNKKLVNNVTTVLITNDNTEVINHYLMQEPDCYESLPFSVNRNVSHNQTNGKVFNEIINEKEPHSIPTNTTTSTNNKPKRLMRKIGKLMLPKMFLNESNNDNSKTKYKDPVIESLTKKSNHEKGKVGRIKSLFMSSSVTSIGGPDSPNDSGKENESGNENTIDELKRQWSIRSETRVHTASMDRRLSQYFNGTTNSSQTTNETKKNERNKEKLSLSINQTVFDISNTTENITPITPMESPIFFSDTSCSVMVYNDDSRTSEQGVRTEKTQRRLKQSSTPLFRAVKRRILSNSFKKLQRTISTFPARDFNDIYIDKTELKKADKAFEKLYKRLHSSS